MPLSPHPRKEQAELVFRLSKIACWATQEFGAAFNMDCASKQSSNLPEVVVEVSGANDKNPPDS